MSAPDKTSETLDLAEAMNSNPSASGSNDDNAVSKAKSKDDQSNANVSDMAKRLNEIDMAFRASVISKESSSDFIVNSEVRPKPIPPPRSLPVGSGASPKKDDLSTTKNDRKDVTKDDGSAYITTTAEFLDQLNHDDPGAAIASGAKPKDDKEWKPEVGSVYDRVLKLQQKEEPQRYMHRMEQHEVENIQVLPEILNCPKCNRKVAAGAINYHMKFCNPDDADQTQQ